MSSLVEAPPARGWWGDGPPPTERWPGVTIEITDCGGKYRFDETQAARVCNFFPKYCSHAKGPFAGKPFELLEYQAELILRPLFGWVRDDGTRRFRKAYIEIPKKNGKTQLVAGLALYMLLADNEPGAEVYVAAADREQARILFSAATAMVESNLALGKRLQIYRNKIVRKDDTTAFFQVLSAEAATKHGPNIHCLIIDELHAQPDRDLFETLTRGVIARRQPLILLITTAGDDDESICVAPDTRLLTTDLRWVRAGDVCVGDSLAGFDENREGSNHRLWQRGVVLERNVATLDAYALEFDDGTAVTCSADHMWLVQTAGRRVQWKKTADIEMTDSFSKVADVWSQDNSREAGYLAGVLDSEGHLSLALRSQMLCGFTQQNNELAAECQRILGGMGLRYGIYETTGVRATEPVFQTMVTRKRDIMRMLGTVRPPRLLAAFDRHAYGAIRFKAFARPKLVRKEFVGPRAVIGLKTTTRTFVAEGLASHNCFEEYEYAKRVLSGTIQDEQHLPVIFEAAKDDDWMRPEIWAKVNPAFGITVDRTAIETLALEAKNEPRKLNDFLRYHLNRWVNQATAWIPVDWWDDCQVEFSDDELKGLQCAAGLDLAQKIDLAAFVVSFRRMLVSVKEEIEVVEKAEDGSTAKKSVSLNYEVFTVPFFWIPEDTMRQHEKDDGVPYALWAREGLVTVTDGAVIDYSRIYEDITTKILPRFPLLKQGFIGYDPAFATDIAIQLRDRAGLKVEEVLQNYTHMNEPAHVLEALIKGKRVRHTGHRILRNHWETVSIKRDDAGRIRPVRPKRRSKHIDGVVGMLMAQKCLMKMPPQKRRFVGAVI